MTHLPLQVNLFTNYAGDRQFSMLRYADELESSMGQYCRSVCEIHRYSPRSNGEMTGGMVSRWKKYIEYPFLALRHRGQINHVTDHGNSHMVKFLPRGRTIVTCHDLIPLRLADRLKGASKRIKYSFWAKVVNMRKAAFIVTDSESTRRDVIDLLSIPSEKVRVVYLGLNHDCFKPMRENETREQFRQQFNFSWPATILHVGGAAFYKNFESVVETLALIRQKHRRDVHLVRMGAPLDQPQLNLISQRGVGAFIHDVRIKNDLELRQLYLASDVFLFPSLWEGFGWPPLEALACGIPVVMSNRGSLSETAGSAALSVEPEDIDAMANAVLRVLDDSGLRIRMRDAGFSQASQFQWEKTASAMAEVYTSIARQL